MGTALSESSMAALVKVKANLAQEAKDVKFKVNRMLGTFEELPNQDPVVKAIIAMLYVCRDCFLPDPYVIKVLTFGKFVYAQYTNKEKHLKLIVHSSKGDVLSTIYNATRRMESTPDFTKAIMRVMFLSKFYPNIDETLFKDLLCICNYSNFLFASTREWGTADTLYYIATPAESPTHRTITLTAEQTARFANTLPAIMRVWEAIEKHQIDLTQIADYRMNFRYIDKTTKRYFVAGRFRHAI